MSEQVNEQQAPSKEEIIKFFQEQIDVKKVQFELQDLNTKLAVARAEELKALSFIAQMTTPQTGQPQGTPHTITQEDLDANPDLQAAGVNVGDEVILPEGVSLSKEEEEAPVEEKKSRKLKTTT